MQVSARDVQALRERTGAGIMDCKKALAEAQGDLEQAAVGLRKKGLAAAAKKAGRLASEGAVGSYIHGGGRIGVMVEVNCETDFAGRNEDFLRFVRDMAMHIAAAAPLCVRAEEAPAELVEREREIIEAQVADEFAAKGGASPDRQAQVTAARLGKYVRSICLLDQPFVREPSQSVAQVVAGLTAKIGERIEVRRFTRYQLGEGLAKRSENFAEEVQKAAAGG